MLCDAVGYLVLSFSTSVMVQLYLRSVAHDQAALREGTLAETIGILAPSALWLACILATGRSVGDLCVELRYAGGPLPAPLARLLRWAAGFGGLSLIMLSYSVGGPIFLTLALLSLALTLATGHGRGLAGLLSAQHLHDTRESPEQSSVQRDS